MVKEIKGYPLLSGARGRKSADVQSLAKSLSSISEMADELKEYLVELDINPLQILSDGEGVVALDALAVCQRQK